MPLVSSITMWKALFLMLVVSTKSISCSFGDKTDSKTVLDSTHDLLPLESQDEATEVFGDSEVDDSMAEESKDSFVFKSSKRLKKKSPGYHIKMQNVSDENFNFLQWYSTPEDVNHHVDGKSDNDTHDLNAQSSSYAEGYSHDYSGEDHHDHHYPPEVDHSHEGDHFDAERTYSYHHQGSSAIQEPKSTDFEKPKRKKVKKHCSRSKGKKSGWPEQADTIVHSMSKSGPEISRHNSNFGEKYGAKPKGRYSNVPPTSGGFIPLLAPMGFSAEHLHGIPKVPFFPQKARGAAHLHIHNHHYHYDARGNKLSSPDPMQSYGKLFQSLGKLRSMLPAMLSGMAGAYPNLEQGLPKPAPINGKTVLNADVKYAEDGEKKGYHYTGPHKSYGRKTYIRMNQDNSGSGHSSSSYENPETGSFGYGMVNSGPTYPEPNMDVHTMGADMFKFGAGQYGTDEFRDGKGRFPNEVKLDIDKDHPGIGFDVHPGEKTEHSYSPESGEPHGPYHDYHSSDYDSGLNKDPKEEPYSTEYHDKSPYISSYDHIDADRGKPYETGYGLRQNPSNGPESPHAYDGHEGSKEHYDDKYSPDYHDKAPYVPYEHIQAERAKEYGNGYGLRQNSHGETENPHPYDGYTDDKSHSHGPGVSSAENHEPEGPHNVQSHSVSYSPGGDVGSDPHLLEPEKDIFNNLRPDPDPLSIPRNARIIEHFIRLDPVHYAPPRIPMEYSPETGFKTNFGEPIPVHKLIPDPLKVPYHPAPPPLVAHPSQQVNQMLRAYQSRSFYHKWW